LASDKQFYQQTIERGRNKASLAGLATVSDIAFAASIVVVDHQNWLYYSLADSKLYRATIRRS